MTGVREPRFDSILNKGMEQSVHIVDHFYYFKRFVANNTRRWKGKIYHGIWELKFTKE
jgi:hypothetical protein